jgi:ribosome-binding protein aMBF1 (putative translation factor)
MSKRPSFISYRECEICGSNEQGNRFVLGYLTDSKYVDLCRTCSEVFESIPDHIPLEQELKYLKAKINEK